MRSLIALLLCLLAAALAAPHNDRFNPADQPNCGPYGTLNSDDECECAKHFHHDKESGKQCAVYHSRRCTQDSDCGRDHAYCMHKLTVQCRLSAHCKNPSGWCVPLDP
ncbi:hypothetical protein PRIPAC_85933 [Pristionchus pacificus]|uniref:Uncharacterized protein n=1 Tax=Pristionchus pacificus TaxID=54126 RepID=A0A454XWA5_PRIPA|nr:hypothetical protein PRIPAC_85933 [Pristionchus pacificus]|eukprot:PDM69070.1 hypothetical protein PRIPAC_47372 [Pristionchus pacificus]